MAVEPLQRHTLDNGGQWCKAHEVSGVEHERALLNDMYGALLHKHERTVAALSRAVEELKAVRIRRAAVLASVTSFGPSDVLDKAVADAAAAHEAAMRATDADPLLSAMMKGTT